MGAVHAGLDRTLDRRVAIKIMHAGLFPDASRQERFVREAKVLAALQESHVVPIHDQGRAEDGTFYLVMDLLDVGEVSCGPDFTTGPFAMNAISFDMNATEAQVVHALCAINPGDVDVTDISVELVATTSGESACSPAEAAVDPEAGAGCGSSGELADLLAFTFTVGNNAGACSSATVSTASIPDSAPLIP